MYDIEAVFNATKTSYCFEIILLLVSSLRLLRTARDQSTCFGDVIIYYTQAEITYDLYSHNDYTNTIA